MKLRSRDEITATEFVTAKNENMLKIKEMESKISDLTKIDDTLMEKFNETIELLEMLCGGYKTSSDSQKGMFVRTLVIELLLTHENELMIEQKEPFQALFDEFFQIGGPSCKRMELFYSLTVFFVSPEYNNFVTEAKKILIGAK